MCVKHVKSTCDVLCLSALKLQQLCIMALMNFFVSRITKCENVRMWEGEIEIQIEMKLLHEYWLYSWINRTKKKKKKNTKRKTKKKRIRK